MSDSPARLPLAKIDEIILRYNEMPADEVRLRYGRILASMRDEIRETKGAERSQRVELFAEMKRRNGNIEQMRSAMKQLIVGMTLHVKVGFAGKKVDYETPIERMEGA